MACLQMGWGWGGESLEIQDGLPPNGVGVGGVIRDTRWLASKWGGGGGVIRDTRWLASKWGGGGGGH